jgi:hypothetical protein
MIEVELKNEKKVLLLINHISSIEDLSLNDEDCSLIIMNNGKNYVSSASYNDLKEGLLAFYNGVEDE